jgi:hypothetical protein
MSNTRKEKRKLENIIRQQELLKNFEGEFYQEKKVGNNWLVKMFNKDNGKWQVAVYSEDSYRKYKDYQKIIKCEN